MNPQKDKNPFLYWLLQRQQKKAARAASGGSVVS